MSYREHCAPFHRGGLALVFRGPPRASGRARRQFPCMPHGPAEFPSSTAAARRTDSSLQAAQRQFPQGGNGTACQEPPCGLSGRHVIDRRANGCSHGRGESDTADTGPTLDGFASRRNGLNDYARSIDRRPDCAHRLCRCTGGVWRPDVGQLFCRAVPAAEERGPAGPRSAVYRASFHRRLPTGNPGTAPPRCLSRRTVLPGAFRQPHQHDSPARLNDRSRRAAFGPAGGPAVPAREAGPACAHIPQMPVLDRRRCTAAPAVFRPAAGARAPAERMGDGRHVTVIVR